MADGKLRLIDLTHFLGVAPDRGIGMMSSDEYTINLLQQEIGRDLKLATLYNVRKTNGSYAIDNNKNVIGLNLEYMGLSNFPKQVCSLTKLVLLQMPMNFLTSIPSQISGLTQLESLYLGGNKLAKLPQEIGSLPKLKLLSLSGNKLESLPSEFANLSELRKLSLRNNNLESVPAELLSLGSLKDLDLRGNQLKVIPKEITRLVQLEKLSLDGNPLDAPPLEIAKRGVEAVFSYLQSLDKSKKVMLSELKVLLIGDGSAGKTSLVKRVRKEAFNQDEPQTHGIMIHSCQFKENAKEITAHFWDFGGQEIYHSTHQFFMTKRSLYLVVLDGRKDDRPEYWFKLIESFGGRSPILVVLNKIDENPAFDLNRKFLKEKYPCIVEFYRVSCANGTGIPAFVEGLKSALAGHEMLKTMWPQKWFIVKKKLEKSTVDCIGYEQYEKLCAESDVLEAVDQKTLLGFLTDLGIMLHFGDFQLKHASVLQPRWLTNAVYTIMSSDILVDNKGILKLVQVDQILVSTCKNEFRYSFEQCAYIINIMCKFELCYMVGSSSILIPDLLEIQEPKFDFDFSSSLKFIISYDFLPKSVMSRFIVKSHKDIKDDLSWRTGVVLERTDLKCTEVVKADSEANKISIFVNGEQKRDYLSATRSTFRDINQSFSGLNVTELVPLPDNNDITIEYQELIGHEQMKQELITIGKLRRSYNVKELLEGIESAGRRFVEPSLGNVIIYSEKTEVTDMSKTIVGSTITDSTVILGENIMNCLNTIDSSEKNDELKNLLKELVLSVKNMNETLPEDKAERSEKYLKRFVDEATSKSPEKEWWEVSAKGLKEAASAVGEVGTTVIEILGKIIPFLTA